MSEKLLANLQALKHKVGEFEKAVVTQMKGKPKVAGTAPSLDPPTPAELLAALNITKATLDTAVGNATTAMAVVFSALAAEATALENLVTARADYDAANLLYVASLLPLE